MPNKQKKTNKDNNAKYDYAAEKRLLNYFKPYWYCFVLGLLCAGGISAITLWFTSLIKNVFNIASRAESGSLGWTALLIIGMNIIKWVLQYSQAYVSEVSAQKVAIKLRNELFTHLNTLSLNYFERTKVGHLMSRMTNDVFLIQINAPSLAIFATAPITIIVLTVAVFIQNWKLALLASIALPVMSYAITAIGHGLRSLNEGLQIRLADVAAFMQEKLSAIRIVKSFGMEDYENDRFAILNRNTYGAALKAVRRSAAVTPTVELIGVTGIAIVLWVGGDMAVKHEIPGFNTGALVQFIVILNFIGMSARDVAKINVIYHQMMTGAKRVFEVLDVNPEIADSENARELQSVEGHVEFRDVHFTYDGKEQVLNGISFTDEPGQVVALVGPSGAGKSTIANLVPRLYDVSSGLIMVDGIDIRDIKLKSLRKHIAIVPQDTILFSTSIKENIAYGRMDASEEEIIEAAKAANAHTFIERLPEGYDTMVGERGVRLSGGERQRVSIARALLKDPKILILDEATSSLDVASESVVQEALDRLMQKRTTLVIAHRLSTIIGADKILVIDKGKIVEEGTHQELVAKGGLYSELYSIQNRGGATVP